MRTHGWIPEREIPPHVPLRLCAKPQRPSLAEPSADGFEFLDLRPYCSAVEDQAQTSSCVAQAVVGALELLLNRNKQPFRDLSREFVYYNARLLHQAQTRDEGTFINLAFETLTTLGTCSEATWPFDVDKVFERPSLMAYREAYPNRTSEFYAIKADGEALEQGILEALRDRHGVVFGMTVDEAYQAQDSPVVPMPKRVRVGPGGHAQLIVGADTRARQWIVRNSWGKDWGQNGYAFVPFDYLPASDASDFYVATLEPTSSVVRL